MNKEYSTEKMLKLVKFDDKGLVPAIVQDINTNRVLMLAYMNEASFRRTIKEEKACFYSRSRQQLWLKGETSGNYQHVREIKLDCDGDTILLSVEPEGPACHTGEISCFYRSLKKFAAEDNSAGSDSLNFDAGNEEDNNKYSREIEEEILSKLAGIIAERNINRPDNSYTAELLAGGIKDIAQKIGEEGVELSLAALADDKREVYEEAADLIYHLMVLLEARGLSLQGVLAELSRRYQN